MGNDRYKRNPPTLRRRDKVLIMCSGATEETYFSHYKEKHKRYLQNVSVQIVSHKKSNPMAVVQTALKLIDDYDEVWAVFDKDDFTDFDNAVLLALKNGLYCAFSNEAIEYWFLLHYENKTGAISRNALNAELARKLGFEYNKSIENIQRVSSAISSKLLIAEERAHIGHERHKANFGTTPSDWRSCTTIYALTKRLREWSNAKGRR